MTGYEILVFGHILSVIVWVGGGIMLQILLYRAKRLGPEAVGVFGQAASWTSNRVFMPASFAALISGLWLIGASEVWGFSDPWIGLGLAGYIASALIGTLILGPTSKKMTALAAGRGPHDPVVTHMARRIDRAGRLDLIILVAVVFDMVIKPGA